MKCIIKSNNQIYNTLYEAGYWIQFIDGKWFINRVEYPFNGVKGIRRILERNFYKTVFRNIDEVDKWLEWFKENNK